MTRPSGINALDSFGTAGTLEVGDPLVPHPTDTRPADPATSLQSASRARKPPAPRRRTLHHGRPDPDAAGLGNCPEPQQQHRPEPVAGVPPRHQRRPHPRRPGRHAARDGQVRRRSRHREPPRAGRAGHRPLGHRRRLRAQRRSGAQRGDRVLPQQRTVSVPAVGTADARGLRRGAARRRDHAPGQHRVPRPGRDGRGRLGVSRRLPGHRLAHHDGQRPRRPRLGDRRHRGRGRDARPVPVHAVTPRCRLPSPRRTPRGSNRDRPRAHHHRDDATPRSGREVRRVLRPRRHRDSPSPTAPPSPT